MSSSTSGESELEKRDRGILTHADREFLHGERDDITDQAKRDARYRIRKRLGNALVDLGMLSYHLEDKDRKRVFETIAEEYGSPVFQGAFALPVHGLFDVSESIDEGIQDLEDILERVIRGMILRIDDELMVDVDVDIDAPRTKPDIDELKKKFNREEVTTREFRYLTRMGEVEWNLDNMIRYLRHEHQDGYLDDLLETHDEIGFQPEEGETISVEHGGEFEKLIEELRKAWPSEQADQNTA